MKDKTFLSKPIDFLKSVDFHRYNAKSTGESLLIHSYNTYFLVSKLMRYIPNLTEEDKIKLKIASLLHDYGKIHKEYQEKLHGPHKLRDEDVQKIKELVLKIKRITDEDLDDIIYIIQNHHDIDLEKVNSNRDRLTRIISICDNIVSNQDINAEVINLINSLIDNINYECFSVELIEHPISSYVIGAFDFIYKRNNIEPILFAKNGTIYIKKKNQKIPSLEEVNKHLNDQIKSLFGDGCLIFENTNNRVYVSPYIFLILASEPDKFIEVVKSDVEKRLLKFKKYQRGKWDENKEKIYLLGRVCGWVHDSVIELCGIKRKNCPKGKGGFPNEKTVEFIEKEYGKNKSYLVIIKELLKKYQSKIKSSLIKSSYNIGELLAFNSVIITEKNIDIQEEAKNDYNLYWNKNPIGICRVCHTFKQESTPAALFPASDLGGGKDVFLTDLMKRSTEFKDKGGVCKWCLIWFLLLKNKTGNKLYKLCIVPHTLFGRIDWNEALETDNVIRIGSTPGMYPHIAVIGLSGTRYADFILQAVKNEILDKLYENGFRGKVISTLVEQSFYLLDCGGIKIKVDEYNLFKPILDNINTGKGINTYALAIKSLKNNKYSWGYLIKTNKLKNDPHDNDVIKMVKELGEQTGLSFLKNIWIGGRPENKVSNAEKLIRRMNETLRKLKDKEDKDKVIDAMVSIGRKVVISTREFRDWGDERKQKEIDALKNVAEMLYKYKENGSIRTELVRAMVCYLGYVPYTIGDEKR